MRMIGTVQETQKKWELKFQKSKGFTLADHWTLETARRPERSPRHPSTPSTPSTGLEAEARKQAPHAPNTLGPSINRPSTGLYLDTFDRACKFRYYPHVLDALDAIDALVALDALDALDALGLDSSCHRRTSKKYGHQHADIPKSQVTG